MRKIAAFIMKYVYAAVCCLYLFTVGILFARNRSIIAKICNHFGYVQKSVDPIIPKVELSEIVPENVSVQIREATVMRGNVRLLELIVISKIIRGHSPSRLFEIGTFDGRTTLNMAANSSEEAVVYTLDLPKEELHSAQLPLAPGDEWCISKEMSGSRYLGTDCAKRIIQLYGDSATFDFSPYHGKMDLVFIDGSHSYQYVLNDSRQALKMLRNGKAMILWHDYNDFEGVTTALNELYAKDADFRGLKYISGTHLACLING